MFRLSISNSDSARAISFAVRAAVFLVPIVVCVFVLELYFYRVGESWSFERLLDEQEKSPELVWSRTLFEQQFVLYKPLTIQRRRPKIVALGSSRVMKFRESMFFPHGSNFYNGGNLIQEVSDYSAYSRLVSEGVLPTPNSVILGIDHWWLRPDKRYVSSWLDGFDKARDAVFSPVSHISAFRLVPWYFRNGFVKLDVIEKGVPTIGPIDKRPVVGMLAYSDNSGFRSDGSRHAPFEIYNHLADNDDYRQRLDGTIEQAKNRQGIFRPFDRVDSVLFDSLVVATERLTSRGVYVHFFLTAFPDTVIDVLEGHDDSQQMLNEFYSAFAQQLRTHDIPVTVSKKPAQFGLNDEYMLDGVHPSEVFMTYVLEDIIRDAPSSSLLSQIDVSHLRGLRHGTWSTPVTFAVPEIWRNLLPADESHSSAN